MGIEKGTAVVLVEKLSNQHWFKNFREVTEMLSKIIGRSFTDEGTVWGHRHTRSKLTRFRIQSLFELT